MKNRKMAMGKIQIEIKTTPVLELLFSPCCLRRVSCCSLNCCLSFSREFFVFVDWFFCQYNILSINLSAIPDDGFTL